jgi:NAD(P) transhydrogenase subunit alpha
MTEALLAALYIFVIAMFLGFAVITKVPPLLHTPLMSGSNAISGITIIGPSSSPDDKRALCRRSWD